LMRIDITSLTQGTNRIKLAGNAESLDLTGGEVVLVGPVAVELTLNVLDENIRVDGLIRTEVAEDCSRCLAEFKRPLEVEIHLYAAGKGSRGNFDALEVEDERDPAEGFLTHDGRELDLRDEVRSAILLSSPMQPLCRPDCKGLCQECGGNLNEGNCSCGGRRADLRWKGLEKLRGQ